MTWQRHDPPPWDKGSGRQYGADLGERGWIVVWRVFDHEGRRTVWAVLWAPAGWAGPRPSIVVVLFEARRCKAALKLAELWMATMKPEADHA